MRMKGVGSSKRKLTTEEIGAAIDARVEAANKELTSLEEDKLFEAGKRLGQTEGILFCLGAIAIGATAKYVVRRTWQAIRS